MASWAQKPITGEVETRVVDALKSGNAEALAKDFFSSIDLTTPDNEGTHSSTQASMILKSFFKSNPPASFEVKQQGASTDGSRFTIGMYKSANGKEFRILFLVRKVGADYKVHMLEIESE